VKELRAQLADRKVELDITPEAMDWLAKHGYSAQFGARPMARLIHQEVKKPMADALLFGDLQNGGKAIVTVVDDKIAIEALALEPA
jgi:ATP-dependent Clp protease ATP-binding subunit ClpA